VSPTLPSFHQSKGIPFSTGVSTSSYTSSFQSVRSTFVCVMHWFVFFLIDTYSCIGAVPPVLLFFLSFLPCSFFVFVTRSLCPILNLYSWLLVVSVWAVLTSCVTVSSLRRHLLLLFPVLNSQESLLSSHLSPFAKSFARCSPFLVWSFSLLFFSSLLFPSPSFPPSLEVNPFFSVLGEMLVCSRFSVQSFVLCFSFYWRGRPNFSSPPYE